MSDEHRELRGHLKAHYRSHGWAVVAGDDGVLHASGPGGVTWLGCPIAIGDLKAEDFDARLVDLADRRMPHGGELCPVDLLAAEECEAELRAVLARLGLSRKPHISIYSLASA